jgi:TonB-linked SusC/RagA family outer membrane protein
MRFHVRIRYLLVLAAIAAGRIADAQSGRVEGRVTDASTGQPVPAAQVAVIGTTLGRLTDAEGRYAIAGVSPGAIQLRVLRVGYAEQRQGLAIAAGQTATLDFVLRPVSIELAPVVTTATGEQRKLEVGNQIANINAADIVETRPVANMSDLLTGRAPGIQVLPGNMTGTGARVRIRGTNSLSLTNDPIYIIDGMRMEASSGSSSIGIGGSIPTRVGDLNPEEIETIEVVKGPSAATLYGTDAANGVIVIRTKRGRPGPARWSMYVEQGLIKDLNDYPIAYRGWRTGTTTTTNSTPSNAVQCFLTQVSAGTCVQDSITRFNLFEDDETSPLGTGRRQQFGLQVRGGSEALRYFVSGEWEDEVGVLEIPSFDVQRLNRDNIEILDEWMRPNALEKVSARANLDVSLGSKAELGVRTGFIHNTQRLPQTDNNTTGLLSSAYGGPGFKYNRTAAGDTLYGYRAFTPGDIFQETVTQEIDRFMGGINTNWRPLSWLATRGNFGVDFVSRVDSDLCRFANCSDFGTSRLGFRENNRTTFYQYTVDVSSTASFRLRPTLNSQTAVGVQYFQEVFRRNGAFGEILPPGATTVTAGAVKDADEATTLSRTLGAFIEQTIGWREVLFATAAVRVDDNSAFGADFSAVYYPKFALSWIASDESFFRKPAWMDLLRFRAAVGQSGVRPGTTDAKQFFTVNTARVDAVESAGLVLNALGNTSLKPETTTEVEAGFDLTLLASRLGFEFTYYNKDSRNALVERVLPPSGGLIATTRFENLGKVRNTGLEALITAQLFERPAFGWDLSLSGSTNKNTLVDLGDVPPIVGQTIRQIEGFPLNSYWQRSIDRVSDANGDGIITLNEITVSDSAQWIGYSVPRHEVVLNSGIDFFQRRVRLAALFDYKGGHRLHNGTERIRCQNRLNCRGLVDRTAPLWEQARVVAMREHASRTEAGFMEDASFIRFRELSLTLTAPEDWAGRFFRANRASLTLAARNLALFTDYSGLDPESNYSQADVPNDFQTAPPPSYFTLRLNVEF